MILSKDLQEILEGVHYFLSETLSNEPLTGKVECLRRGLVLQLEALALSYPTLRIRARSSVSLPYLAMDQGPSQLLHRLSESLSSASSGTNSYSNNSSGDGLVMGSGRGGCVDSQQQQLSFDSQSVLDEEYEDFQDNSETKSISDPNGVLKDGDVTHDDLDDNEDVYMESLEAVSFSTIIATCDKHGMLGKKTKGLIRSLKNYQCVVANGKLYLYLKETDERQRKTIDLTGYTARIATGEEIRDQRKRDAAFEIVGPGKKTHTFIARTARDRVEWLAALGRTIRGGRSRTLPTMSTLSGVFGNLSSEANPLILPPKGPPVAPITQKPNDVNKEEDFYYHDVADDAKEEVYEVVGPEGTVFGKPVGTAEIMPSRPAPHPPNQDDDLQDYDPVSPEDVPPPLPDCPPPSATSFGRSPPERPPLPATVQDRVNKQASRPLPDAPSDTNYNSYDPGGIYCEIEEDLLEHDSENVSSSTSDEKVSPGDATYVNRNNTDQDSKKPRAVSADGLPQDSDSMSPSLSSRASTNSLVGSFSDEILMNINLSEPNLSQHTPHKYSIRPASYKTPPKLPPKGIPLPPVDDDDSEYKVPPSSIMDVEYQIPPNPIPTEPRAGDAAHNTSEMYQVPSSQQIVVNKAETNEKPLLASVDKKEEAQPKSNLKALTKQFEKRESSVNRDLKDSKLLNQGTSVKDMIARLNKSKTMTENVKVLKPKETLSNSSSISSDQVDGDSAVKKNSDNILIPPDSKGIKPNLPPRPQNLLTKTTLSNRNSSSVEEETKSVSEETATETDDDYYETPEGNSFDSGSIQDVNGASTKEMTVPWRTKLQSTTETTVAAEKGEWYVAKFAFVATTDQAVSFNRGDMIFVHENTGPSGWWQATVKGRSGVVPREYLKKKES